MKKLKILKVDWLPSIEYTVTTDEITGECLEHTKTGKETHAYYDEQQYLWVVSSQFYSYLTQQLENFSRPTDKLNDLQNVNCNL